MRQDAGEATPASERTRSSAWPLVAGVGGGVALMAVALALVVRRRRRSVA